MAFIEITPKSNNGIYQKDTTNCVRIAFYKSGAKSGKNDWWSASIMIGANLFNEAGFSLDKRLKILIDTDRPLQFLIESCDDGYTVYRLPSGKMYKIGTKWFLDAPMVKKPTTCEHKMVKGGILVTYPEVKE